MKMNVIRHVVFPLLAALIWGTAFVAQSIAAESVPPFAFSALRSAVAVLFLLLVSRVFDFHAARRGVPAAKKPDRGLILKSGLCCGLVLSASVNLQQTGLSDTSAGKAGFITAFYVVLVPVLGIFLKRKVGPRIWVAVALALGGLYLLCLRAGEGFELETSDLYVLMCAFFFAAHILIVDHFVDRVDGIKLSCAQFAVVAVVSAVLSLCFETVDWNTVAGCVGPILYLGIGSSGIAYTLQILSQEGSNPAVVSLLFSTESVFSVLAGAVLLHERMTGREYLGCVLMFLAVILAQIPVKKREKGLQT